MEDVFSGILKWIEECLSVATGGVKKILGEVQSFFEQILDDIQEILKGLDINFCYERERSWEQSDDVNGYKVWTYFIYPHLRMQVVLHVRVNKARESFF